MPKINPLIQEQKNYQKQLKKVHRTHEDSIDKIKNRQEVQKLELRHANQVELENIRDEQDVKIAQEIERRDKVLTDISNTIKTSKEFTEKQLDNLKYNIELQMQNQDSNFKVRYEAKGVENEDSIYRAYNLYNNKMQQLHRENKREIEKIQIDNNLAKRKQYQINQLSLNKVKDNHQQRMHQTKKLNELAVENQRVEYNKNLNSLKDKHNRKVQDNESTYKKKMQVLQKQHHSKVKEENERFEKKFLDVKNKNEKVISRLDNQTEEIITDIQKRFAHDVDVELEKLKDQFYHTRQVVPHVSDKGSFYEIKLKVPEHEIKNIQLTGKDRKLKLSMNRSLDQKVEESDNVKAHTKKVETHLVEIDVDDIVNTSKLSKAYKNNHLTFKVAKK